MNITVNGKTVGLVLGGIAAVNVISAIAMKISHDIEEREMYQREAEKRKEEAERLANEMKSMEETYISSWDDMMITAGLNNINKRLQK